MTQDFEKYVEEFDDVFVSNSLLFDEKPMQNGVVTDNIKNWLRTTLTKVAEEARREERERIVAWAKKQKTERKSDPWAYGFNMDMTAGLCEGMNDLIAHLSDNK